MKATSCPLCADGQMVEEEVVDHTARLGGIEFRVPLARIRRCSSCGEVSVSGPELKRWKECQRQDLGARGHVPIPEDVRRLRHALKMTVADFGALLAVTRQTVHAWERDQSGPMALGPAAMLIRALQREAVGAGLRQTLFEAAKERGQLSDHVASSIARDPSVPGTARTRVRPRGFPSFSNKAA